MNDRESEGNTDQRHPSLFPSLKGGAIGTTAAVGLSIAALLGCMKKNEPLETTTANTLQQTGDTPDVPAHAFLNREEAQENTIGKIAEATPVPRIFEEDEILEFIHQLQNGNTDAIKTLGEIGDTRAVEPLIPLLNHQEAAVRILTANALGNIGFAARSALPTMREISERDESPDVQNAAKEAMKKIDEVDQLINQMRNADAKIRKNAVVVLYNLISQDKSCKGDAAKATPVLITLLSDENREIRSSAAIALGCVGDSNAVPALMTALGDEDNWVREYAIRALGEIGDQRAQEPLEKMLENEHVNNPRTIATALDALQWKPHSEQQKLLYAIAQGDIDTLTQCNEENTVPVLLERLNNRNLDSKICTAIATALGKRGDKRAIVTLTEVLRGRGSETQNAALASLKQLGWNPDLLEALQDTNPGVRAYAAESLGERGDAKAVDPLLLALSDKEWQVQYAAIRSLGKLKNTKAVRPLIDNMQTLHDDSGRCTTINALKEIGDPTAIPCIVDMFVNGQAANRSPATAEALDSLGWKPQTDQEKVCYLIGKREWKKVAELGKVAIPYLVMGDEDWSIRAAMLRTLGDMGDSSVLPNLVTAIGYESGPAKYALVHTIIKLGDEKIVPDIISRIYNGNDRTQATMILGGLKDPRAVKPLIDLLQSKDSWDRDAAANALGEIGDKRALPSLMEEASKHKSKAAGEAIKKIQLKN